MKLAMVISQTKPELVFNAFRLANFSRKEGDEVKVFLLAEGVELDGISDSGFDVRGLLVWGFTAGILDRLRSGLGIRFGETTPDLRFTLLPVACLGACDRAPVIMVDNDLYGDVTPERAKEIYERHVKGGVPVPDGTSVLFAGDLLESGAPPSFGDAYPLDWPATAARILSLGAQSIVPGHGEPCGKAYLKEQAQIVENWVGFVEREVERGRTPEEIAGLLATVRQRADDRMSFLLHAIPAYTDCPLTNM